MDSAYSWLPGQFALRRGQVADYLALARFHYVAGRPATFAMILAIDYAASDAAAAHPVAVGVLSHPPLRSHARERAMGWQQLPPAERNCRVNATFRTISRIIVHPQFRGIGLAGHLVRTLAALASTRYVEATAQMARVHPLFAASGFRCAGVKAAYFLKQMPTGRDRQLPSPTWWSEVGARVRNDGGPGNALGQSPLSPSSGTR